MLPNLIVQVKLDGINLVGSRADTNAFRISSVLVSILIQKRSTAAHGLNKPPCIFGSHSTIISNTVVVLRVELEMAKNYAVVGLNVQIVTTNTTQQVLDGKITWILQQMKIFG